MSLKLSNPTFGVGKILVEDVEVLSLSNGSTGLGTSLPSSTFDVASAGASPVLSLTATGAYRYQVLTDRSTTSFRIRDQSAGSVDRLIIDAAGNAGFGVFPSAWGASQKAFQVGAVTSIWNNGNTTAYFGHNYYFDGTQRRYLVTGQEAYEIRQGTGVGINFSTAPSGTAGNPITFTQAMTLTQGGNLLVGTTSDATGAKIRAVSTLSGTSSASFSNAVDNDIEFRHAAGTAFFDVPNDNTAIVWRNGAARTERARITSGGNLLVGTTNDAGNDRAVIGGTLCVQGIQASANSDINASLSFRNLSSTAAGETARISCFTGSSIALGQLIFEVSKAGSNPTEAARITSGGYFKASNTGSYGGVAGVGDNSAASTHTLQASSGNNVYIINGGTGAADGSVTSFLPTGSVGFHYRGQINAVLVYQVDANGNVRNTNNSYGAISDAKLKENIVETSPKLDELTKVRIVNYTLKSDPDLKQIGVIAQELEEIFPGLVDSTPDLDEEGNDLGTVTKSVKYSVFVPILIKALQEETAARKSLEDRIAAIEAKLGQ